MAAGSLVFANKAVGILGLGRTGLAAAAFLNQAGANCYGFDDRADIIQKAHKDGHIQNAAATNHADFIAALDFMLLSPGIPTSFPAPHPIYATAKAAGVTMLCDIDLLWASNPDCRYIGITGTNGKSTTTALIAHGLKAAGINIAVGGNLGPAALSLARLPKDGVYVLELSSYQLELIHHAKFDIGILLNIQPDHLDRHGSFENYCAAKASLFDKIKPKGQAYIGIDDAPSQQILAKTKARNIDTKALARTALPASFQARHNLPGAHNDQNLLAALYSLEFCGANEAGKAALLEFQGLKHRLQALGSIGDIIFYNDSKATNPESSYHALNAFADKPDKPAIFWIAGGRSKQTPYDDLRPLLKAVHKAYLLGEAAAEIAAFIGDSCPFHSGKSLADIMPVIFADAQNYVDQHKGQKAVILFSPACASFDQYNDFEQRGDDFIDHYRRLATKNIDSGTINHA